MEEYLKELQVYGNQISYYIIDDSTKSNIRKGILIQTRLDIYPVIFIDLEPESSKDVPISCLYFRDVSPKWIHKTLGILRLVLEFKDKLNKFHKDYNDNGIREDVITLVRIIVSFGNSRLIGVVRYEINQFERLSGVKLNVWD